MSTVWFTADQHFGHEAVSELRGFNSVAEHDDAIIEGWRANVKPADRVWVLGDISLTQVDYALDVFSDLPGQKILIPGNHDACHPMHRNGWQQVGRYLRSFEAVVPFQRIRIAKTPVLMSHFPYERDRNVVRHLQYRLRDEGEFLIHGHTHQTDYYNIQNPREMCVSVDVSSTWAPISVGDIAEGVKWMRHG